MSASLWRALRLLTGRPAWILGAGMMLAVIAETSSIGLLGLSGWYIASCFLFGIGRLPGFSYLGPSCGCARWRSRGSPLGTRRISSAITPRSLG